MTDCLDHFVNKEIYKNYTEGAKKGKERSFLQLKLLIRT